MGLGWVGPRPGSGLVPLDPLESRSEPGPEQLTRQQRQPNETVGRKGGLRSGNNRQFICIKAQCATLTWVSVLMGIDGRGLGKTLLLRLWIARDLRLNGTVPGNISIKLCYFELFR